MSAFLVECPACHVSFRVESETMRSVDRCRDLSCRCNDDVRDVPVVRRLPPFEPVDADCPTCMADPEPAA